MTNTRNLLIGVLIVSLASAGPAAHAGMLGTDALMTTDRERLAAALSRPEVRDALAARGVDAAQVEARVAALSDDEVAQIAGKLDALPAGGNGGDFIFFLVLLAACVYIVMQIWPLILAGGAMYAIAKANGNEPTPASPPL